MLQTTSAAGALAGSADSGTRKPLRDRFMRGLDVGLDPPLDLAGPGKEPIDRRLVSLRWLCGTILTGFAGAGLIGSAMYAALDHQMTFAQPPQMTGSARREAAAGELVNPRKGDRLVKSVDIVAAKQTFRSPTTTLVGDKEVVRIKAFTRVSTTLALTSTGFADEVPAFNPLRLISDNRSPVEAPTDLGPVQNDAEVSFVSRELQPADGPQTGAKLTDDEIQAQVTEYVRAANAVPTGAAKPLSIPPQLLLMRTSRVGLGTPSAALGYASPTAGISDTPFSSIEVRMVPENVSSVVRSNNAKDSEERLFIVHRNETLEDLLLNAGVARNQARAIIAAFDTPKGKSPVAEGERVKLLFVDLEGDGRAQVARLSTYHDDNLTSTIAMTDSGSYVQVSHTDVAVAAAKPKSADDDEEDEPDDGRMKVYDSLYETALKQDIPKNTINDLIRIFSNDVDFQRPVTAGDSFEAFYEDSEEAEGNNQLLYASITTRGETFYYYRYQTPDDNAVDYYDANGRSTRKFLVRQPIAAGRLTSGYGGRFHPILGYTRMHTGVDWAAPIGTPIFAAGTGTIIKAGRESGYGNRVEIQHANGYITTYNHMTGFARGITEGTRVKQGQVIGYLGMTGLATGPHLHYEVIVNGHFVDPMRVKLARTRELDGRQTALFKREKERIDGLIAKAPNAPRALAAKTPG